MKKISFAFLNKAKKMPPLRHKIGDVFDIDSSDVVNWLISIPEVKCKIFDFAKDHGIIVYDERTKTWKGCEYDDQVFSADEDDSDRHEPGKRNRF